MGITGSLNPEQLQFFDSNGYLLIDSFSSPEEIQETRDRMAELLKGFDPSKSSIFSTKNQREVTDEYFYKSAENVSFFFEGECFSPCNFVLQIVATFNSQGMGRLGDVKI